MFLLHLYFTLFHIDFSHQCTTDISPFIVWKYLVSRLEITILKQWIDSVYPAVRSGLTMSAGWPYSLDIHPSFFKELDTATDSFRERILDYLSRYIDLLQHIYHN